jgi:hypothetical protein
MTLRPAPEFGLFCLALRDPQRPQDAEALRRAIGTAPDWKAVIAGARRHRVAARILAGLLACGSAEIPDSVIAALRRQAANAARRDLAQRAELGRLARAFADARLPVLAFKGVVLAAELHGQAFARGARDIDLLVDPDRFGQAHAVLAALGYRSLQAAQSPRQTVAYRQAIKEVEYVHDGTGAMVELHDRLTDNPTLLPSDFATLWSARAQVCVGNAAIPTLARQRLALYLTVHGAGHCWERLLWLVDLAAALRDPGAIEQALALADAAGLGTAMRHALVLAHDWLGLAVAERELAQARASPGVRRLDRILASHYAGAAWHQRPPPASWRGVARYSFWQRLYRVALRTDFHYWTSEAKREWLSPGDWDVVRLPDRLFFLYPVIRPVGWLIRRWRNRR